MTRAIPAVFSLAFAISLGTESPGAQPAQAQTVPLQPLAQQARRLETALRYLGEPLSDADRQALDEAVAMTDEAAAVARLQQMLDARALITVHISPESRVRL